MHINDRELEQFHDNKLNTATTMNFLEHLEHCDHCLDQIIQETEAGLTYAPGYLEKQILQKASSLEIQTEKSVRETSRRMLRFWEGVRTAIGMAAALLLLFGISQPNWSSLITKRTPTALESTTSCRNSTSGRELQAFTNELNEQLYNKADNIGNFLSSISSKTINGGDK